MQQPSENYQPESPVEKDQSLLDRFKLDDFRFTYPQLDDFTFVMICLCPVGYLFQKFTSSWSPTHRYLTSIAIGVATFLYLFPFLEVLCFLVQAGIGVQLISSIPAKNLYKVMFMFCMVFQLVFAIHSFMRISYWNQSPIYVVAIMMSQTQRLTMLSANLYDGWRKSKGAKLTELQQKYFLTAIPDQVKICAYLFNFHQMVFGPVISFSEYEEFMESKDYQEKLQSPSVSASLLRQIAFRFLRGCVCLIIETNISSLLPIKILVSAEFAALPFLTKCAKLLVITFGGRCYYYYMWSFCESTNLAAGLGYSGTDSNGQPQWDIGKCCNILKIELAGSMRDLKSNWNMCTENWLRFIAFERIENKFIAAWSVFLLVYLWHGVNGGYFWYAFTIGYILMAGRECRLSVRPYFHAKAKPKSLRMLYDALSVFSTHWALSYMCIPFFCYYGEITLIVWRQVSYHVHIICTVMIVAGMGYRHRDVWLSRLRLRSQWQQASRPNWNKVKKSERVTGKQNSS